MSVPETPKLSVGEKISAMLEILKGSSSRETGDILKAVAAIKNLRVVSAERSFAQPSTKAKAGGEVKTKQKPKAAVWKTQEWEAAGKEHQVLVQAVKESSEADRPDLILRLREKESSMKLLKKKLQGKGLGAPQGGASAVIAAALAAIAEEAENPASEDEASEDAASEDEMSYPVGQAPWSTYVDTTGLIDITKISPRV
jgi:hypothetical protein